MKTIVTTIAEIAIAVLDILDDFLRIGFSPNRDSFLLVAFKHGV